MRKKILIVLGVLILLLVFLFQIKHLVPFNILTDFYDKLVRLTEKTQVVGMVTANRSASALLITEITSSTWKYPQTVIGKAYKIERTKDDGKSVRVEFAYNPAELDQKIPESALRLYKWHDEAIKPYWALIKSEVDTVRHIVTANLTSFSILAVHAPLMYYWPESDVVSLNAYLASLTKKIPNYSCGISIVVEEEFLEWKDGEIVEHYQRPGEEQTEFKDCRRGPDSVIPAISNWGTYEREMKWGPKQSKVTQYTIDVSIIWQTDDKKSAKVEGVVRDQDGKPLEGVSVVAKKIMYSSAKETAITDKDGLYKFDLHSGQYEVIADPTSGGSGKHKNCIAGGYTEKFYEFGEFSKDPEGYRHGLWQKDVLLQCSDYYIEETLQLPIDATTYGVRTQGTETQHITGRLVKPTSGGYGWEGIWEVDQEFEDKTKQSGTLYIMGGAIKMPPASSVSRDHYKYQFTLLRDAKAGDTFAIVGGRVGEGYQLDTKVSAGTLSVSANNAGAQFNLGDASGKTTAGYVDIVRIHKIISVNGAEGVVLELPSAMSNELPHVSIKHVAK